MITKKQYEVLNSFKRTYLKPGQLVNWNYVKFSKTSKSHQDLVNEICWWLYSNGIPFATETEFKSGCNPDIICPTIQKIIEVRHSEKLEDSNRKIYKLPEELRNQVIYFDTKETFDYKKIL